MSGRTCYAKGARPLIRIVQTYSPYQLIIGMCYLYYRVRMYTVHSIYCIQDRGFIHVHTMYL